MVNISDFEQSASLRIMQFNVLADGLCGGYSSKETEKSFIGVDRECLQWTHRGIRLVEEILRYKPDVVGLEECDQIEDLMKYLGPNGYDYCYQTKGTSPIPKVFALRPFQMK